MILMIDNYDSFVFNVEQYLKEMTDDEVITVRNDAITIDDIKKMNPSKIIFSPGPKHPKDSGICLEILNNTDELGNIPILGICLGHQAIGMNFGGEIKRLENPLHGKTSEITVLSENSVLFKNLPKKFKVMRYHSLYVDDIPEDLEVTAKSEDGVAMAVEHKSKNIFGIQFHPESIFTEYGKNMIRNFLNIEVSETLQNNKNSKNIKSTDVTMTMKMEQKNSANPAGISMEANGNISLILEPNLTMKMDLVIPFANNKLSMYVKDDYYYLQNPNDNQWTKQSSKGFAEQFKKAYAQSNALYDFLVKNIDKIDLSEKGGNYILTMKDFKEILKNESSILDPTGKGLDGFEDMVISFTVDKKHHKHEDLAFLLERKHSPKLINRVYDLAVMELDYKKEDEFFNIARKCTYALGYTNTPKAKEKLELLAKNENELIREYAIKQLNRNDFTDKDVEEQD